MSEELLKLLLVKATVRICPVCLEQVEGDERDEGHFHYGRTIEPLEVEALPLFDQLRAKRDLALFRLQTDIRDSQFAEAERRWYKNLSVADRFWEDSRRKRVAREETEAREAALAAGPPGLSAFERAIRAAWSPDRMMDSFRRFMIDEWQPRDLDEWLASDDHLAEVDAALGLG